MNLDRIRRHEHLRVHFVSQGLFFVDPISNVSSDGYLTEHCHCVSSKLHKMRKKKTKRIIIACISMYAKNPNKCQNRSLYRTFSADDASSCQWEPTSFSLTPWKMNEEKMCMQIFFTFTLFVCIGSGFFFSFVVKSIICLHKWSGAYAIDSPGTTGIRHAIISDLFTLCNDGVILAVMSKTLQCSTHQTKSSFVDFNVEMSHR